MTIQAQSEDGVIHEFAEGTPDSVIDAAMRRYAFNQSKSVVPRSVRQGTSWANQAIAQVGDSILNTPSNLINLAKAGFGTAAVAAGKPDLAPDLTPAPNYIQRGFERVGVTNSDLDPTTTAGRIAKAGVQGLTVGAMSPSQSIAQTGFNSVLSGLSGLFGQGTTEATGSPELGAAASIVAVPALSAASNKLRSNSAVTKQRNSLRDETLTNANKEGYVTPPSAAGGNWFTRRLESIGGKAAVGQEASVRNQQVTNDIARREVGLPENQPISVNALNAKRNELAAPYREVSAINKKAAGDLDALKQARADANSYYRHYDVSADPASLKKAESLSAKAEQLEQNLEGYARKAMKPELIGELRAARQSIAKTWDVERALNVGTGDVSAPILGKLVDKGRPLSGGLATAGKFQQAFPSYAREGEKVPTPGVSKSEALSSLLLGLGGYGAMGPLGMTLAAAPLASGPVRSLMFTQPFQGPPSYMASKLPVLSDPALRGVLLGNQQINGQ